MLFKNDGKSESNIAQNKFTRYLMTAIARKKSEISKKKERAARYEYFVDFLDSFPEMVAESDILNAPVFLTEFENTALDQALDKLGKRERHILFMRVLEEREFSELAAELELKYKGVAAVYYRTIQKIREEMRDDKG